MYDHAFVQLREELSYREGECKKLTLMLQDSEAHSARGEKELGELRAASERALREKAELAAQVPRPARTRPLLPHSNPNWLTFLL